MSGLVDGIGDVVLQLHVQPGAKRTEVVGRHGDAWKVRLATPPVDGKANEELISFMAVLFGVPKRQVEILSGLASRDKRVRISGASLWPAGLSGPLP